MALGKLDFSKSRYFLVQQPSSGRSAEVSRPSFEFFCSSTFAQQMARSGWLCLFIVLLCRLSSKVSFIYNIPLKRNSGRSAGIQRKFVQSAEGGSSQKFFVGGPHLNNSVFCNVELNGANLQAVGFDMDFTLAQVRSNFFSPFPYSTHSV